MDIFVTSIKEKYLERLINREKQWPPCHSNKLVRLELVEREKGVYHLTKEQKGRGRDVEIGKDRNSEDVKRTPLAYSDLFKVEGMKRPIRKVLVEGDAGIGKTTLSVSVSEDWAKGMLFQQFELVLLLPLRHKEVAAVGSIPELLTLLHSSKKLCSTIADSLEQTEGKKVLIIADGWDELAESGRLEGSFLYKLVFGEFLPFVSVLLTSRPSASAPLHQLPCIDQFIEVRGFRKEHIVEFIQSEFANDQEKAGHLLEQVEYNPLVESVCSVPLNCAIICHLWRTLEEALPTTMTELYKKIVLNVILRNIKKKDEFLHISNLINFSALPKELQQPWELLCKFAFEAIVKDQIVFSEEELADIFPHGLGNVLCFGLLQTASTILETGYGTSFHFLHLTFQEYLAALYIVKQISESDNPKQFMSIVESRRYAVICRFICGIYFNEIKFTCFTNLQPLIPESDHTLCYCAFEAKGEDFCSNTIRLLDYSVNFYADSAYDCAAVLYVIDNMQEGNVDIMFGNSGIRETQIRELADILARKNGMLQVKELNISCNKLTDKSISDLFQRASSSFQSLKELNLQGNRIGRDSITLLGKSTFNQLSSLTLSDCPLGVSGMQALEDAVCSGSLRGLKYLYLAGSLTSDADVNGALLATSLDAIVSYCHNLSYFDLARNNLGVSGASALARILYQYKSDSLLQKLDLLQESRSVDINLGETSLGDKGLIAFVKCSGHIDVCQLSLNGNNIHATGVSYLADGVCNGEIVLQLIFGELSLDDNPLGLEGTAEVGRILSSSHCKLREISLRRCHLTTPGSSLSAPSSANLDINVDKPALVSIIRQKVCHTLQNNAVEVLRLDDNNFNGDGILILAGLMHLCPGLTILSSCHCGITSDDLKQLLEHLTNYKDLPILNSSKLEHWNLSNNEIDDNGAIALMDRLPSLFPNFGSWIGSGVDFSGNYISSEIIRRTREEINRLTKERRERRRIESVRNKENQKFQRDWEEIVDILYDTANDLLYRPYPYPVVVKEEENDKPCFSGSTGKDNPVRIHTEETAAKETVCCSYNSKAEERERSYDCGGSNEKEDVTSTYSQDVLVSPSVHEEIMSEQCEGSSSLTPVPLPLSIPTVCESMEVKQECCAHSSDDDSETETFCTPPTSPTDEHDGSLPVAAEGHTEQTQTHSSAPELKDLDLIKLVNWQGVGLQLGIEDYELQKIRLNYQEHDDRKREMFRAWLRTCKNLNCHDLIKALEAAGESKAAQQINE